MTIVRRHLRLWVAAWLVFQVATLSALVPRDCCLAHKPAASGHGNGCHEGAATIECPMPAADGTPCPMHRDTHRGAAGKSDNQCTLRGSCDGPMAALFALLSNHGVLTDSIAVSPDVHSSVSAIQTRESLIGRLPVPDPPPPRA